jgi:hypothetical protein
MSLSINRFVDRVRTAEIKQQRDIIMTLREAQDLHTDITKLLIALTALQDEVNQKSSESVVRVEMDGGSF